VGPPRLEVLVKRPVKCEQTIIIVRAPRVVFAYRCDLECTAKWQRGVVSSSRATPGPTQLGTRWNEQRRTAGGELEEWELEVTEYQMDRLLRISARRGTEHVEELHQLADEGGATRYTLSVELQGSTSPPALVQRQTIENLLHLKWRLEAEARQAS
jgi:hypothetical protein